MAARKVRGFRTMFDANGLAIEAQAAVTH